MVRKGTRPGDGRGNSYQRRARKLYLMATHGVEGIVTCYLCSVPMGLVELTVDRIVPGARGGTYARTNIRPACGPCNTDTGNELKAALSR